jgi:hypothetical protein
MAKDLSKGRLRFRNLPCYPLETIAATEEGNCNKAIKAESGEVRNRGNQIWDAKNPGLSLDNLIPVSYFLLANKKRNPAGFASRLYRPDVP